VKFNTAALLVHELVTDASVQGFPVLVVPTLIVEEFHVSHLGHFRVVLASVSVI
jgi:hypothetical protein